MDMSNQSVLTEFVLLGFSNDLNINIALFFLFLICYLITVVGNVLIFCTVLTNAGLYIPMYFFLCNLSLIDFCYSSTAVPRLLSDLFSSHRSISIGHCAIQLYVIVFMGGTECQLLVLMAYDRFLAICRPLHYPVLMRWSVCYWLTAFVWFFSFMISIVPSLVTPLKLCHRDRINHFMCEIVAVTKLSCDDISTQELGLFSLSFVSLLFPFMLILLSYSYILSTVLKISSVGRNKALSTCTSHVTVVILFFGTGMVTYFGPSSQYSSNREKYVSVFYVVLCPMLNPLIYSLNNREIKKSLTKIFSIHALKM